MTPLITVLLPTYNGSRFIQTSIESVLNQSYKNIELLIINDGSTDNVEDIILEYKNKDERITYVLNKQNLKLTRTLNKGIDIAKGEWIARVDDDDVWFDNDKLSKQVDYLEKNPNCKLIGTNAILMNVDGKEIGQTDFVSSDKDIKDKMILKNQFVHSSVLFEKKAVMDLGKYDLNAKYVEDYDLWFKFCKNFEVSNILEPCLKYRIIENSISVKNEFKQKWGSIKVIWENRKGYEFFKVIKSLLIWGIFLIVPTKLYRNVRYKKVKKSINLITI